MAEKAKLREIERKMFTSYHGDGLLDICIGSVLLYLVFIIWWLPEFWFFLIAGFMVWISVYAGVKKSVTVPRLGYVEFSSVRRQRIQQVVLAGVLVLVVFNILGILAMIYPALGVFLFESAFTILIAGIIGAFLLTLIGFMLDLQRFYAYGVVFLISGIFTFLVPVLPLLPLIVLGCVILVYGLILFYQFLTQYPKQTSGEVAGA
ncbi:MAG: hypothetical protein ACFFAL_00055 [Promethearchaeota archaeon]